MQQTAEEVVARKFIRLRERNQITLPAEILSGLTVHTGDFLEISRTADGSIHLKPTVLVIAGSTEAQRQEMLADEDIANGRYKTFNNAADLMADMERKHQKKTTKASVKVAARAVK